MKRHYNLGKRMDQIDQTKAKVLRAARRRLEAKIYRKMTISSLADETGVTRQTVYNLFGTKIGIVQALFDAIFSVGGVEKIHEVMTPSTGEGMLERFVEVSCQIWLDNRQLLRGVYGIRAIDPEFGVVIEELDRRRSEAVARLIGHIECQRCVKQKVLALSSLTSFKFFDSHVDSLADANQATALVLRSVHELLAGGWPSSQAVAATIYHADAR